MSQETRKSSSNLSQHILPTSATMVGVCMTVISIIKLIEQKRTSGHIDEFLAVTSVVFLLSAAFSYYSIRHESEPQKSAAAERLADITFMLGLAAMSLVGFLLAYEIM